MKKKLHIHKIAQLTGHNASIFSLAAGKDERHFLSGGGEGWVAEWNLDAPELGKLIAKVEAQIFSLLFLKNQNKLFAGTMNGGLHWIDLEHPERTKNIAHHRKGVFDICKFGDFIFTIGGAGMLTKWSVETAQSLESYQLSKQSLRCLDFCESRNEIAVGASNNAIYLLDATDLTPKKILQNAHQNSVFALKYHPSGTLLLSGGRDAHLNVWDLENDFQKCFSQPAHWFTVNSIAFHPGGDLFATASRDKSIKIWDSDNFHLLKVLDATRNKGHVNSVNKLFWSNYKNQLISCSDDRSLIIWGI